jgi:hypothetical protein
MSYRLSIHTVLYTGHSGCTPTCFECSDAGIYGPVPNACIWLIGVEYASAH